MNKALIERRISAVFLSYVILVLNVKRGLGMFNNLQDKNHVSASDPKQGAAFHHILANFVLKGTVENGFLLHGVDDDLLEALTDPNSENVDTTSYLESAASKLDIVRANLGSFDKFTRI